jgi:predicted transcriptional regulator
VRLPAFLFRYVADGDTQIGRVEFPIVEMNFRLTLEAYLPNLEVMDVQLSPDLQSKLARLAEQQGRDSADLVVEAVERMVGYDEWFLSEVDKGLTAADRGEFVEHEAVRALINSRYPA